MPRAGDDDHAGPFYLVADLRAQRRADGAERRKPLHRAPWAPHPTRWPDVEIGLPELFGKLYSVSALVCRLIRGGRNGRAVVSGWRQSGMPHSASSRAGWTVAARPRRDRLRACSASRHRRRRRRRRTSWPRAKPRQSAPPAAPRPVPVAVGTPRCCSDCPAGGSSRAAAPGGVEAGLRATRWCESCRHRGESRPIDLHQFPTRPSAGHDHRHANRPPGGRLPEGGSAARMASADGACAVVCPPGSVVSADYVSPCQSTL